MEEIYKTPESELGLNEKVTPHGFWRFYFWIHAVLLPVMVATPFILKKVSVLDYVDLAAFLVETIMVFGYAYSKRIFSKLFWEVFFTFYIVWVVVYGFVLPFGFDIQQYGEQTKLDFWFLIDPVFYILSIIVLYYYVFKSQQIWLKP